MTRRWPRPRPGETLAVAAAYVAIALLLEQVGAFGFPPENAVSAEAGFALAIALLRGPRTWAGLWLGASLTIGAWAVVEVGAAPTARLWIAAMLSALIRAVATAGAAAFLLRIAPARRLLRRSRAVLAYALIGGLLLPALFAAAFAAALLSLGYGPRDPAWLAVVPFGISWSAGTLIVGPLILLRPGLARPRGAAALEAAACTIAVVVGSVFVFATARASAGHPPVHFLLPVLLWATLRFRAAGAITAVALAAVVAMVATPLRLPPDQAAGALARLQPALEVTAVTFLLLAATLEERREAQGAAAEERLLLASRVAERTAALQAERDVADLVIRTLGAIVMVLDVEGRFVLVNPAFARATGWRPEEVLGRDYLELCPPPERERATTTRYRLRRGGQVHSPEAHILTRDGGSVEVDFSSAAVRGPDGKVELLFATAIDVSDRAHARRNLEEALALLRATLDATADGIAVVDAGGVVRAHNQRFAALWGLPSTLLADGRIEDVVRFLRDRLADPDELARRFQWLASQPEPERTDELDLLDGRSYALLARPCRIAGETTARVYTVRDVTRQRSAERERLRLLDAEGGARHAAEWAAFVANEAVRTRDSFLVAVSLALRPALDRLATALLPLRPSPQAPSPAGANELAGPAVDAALRQLEAVQGSVAQLLAAFPVAEVPEVHRG